MNGKKTLQEKLEAAKEKVAVREFEVTITETFQMKVTVEAKDQAEAEQIVNDKWNECEYLIDAEYFTGAAFNAVPVKAERSHGNEER